MGASRAMLHALDSPDLEAMFLRVPCFDMPFLALQTALWANGAKKRQAAGSFATKYGCWESAADVSHQVQLFRALNSVQTDFKAGTDALEEALGRAAARENVTQPSMCSLLFTSGCRCLQTACRALILAFFAEPGCSSTSSSLRQLHPAEQRPVLRRMPWHSNLVSGHRKEVFRAH